MLRQAILSATAVAAFALAPVATFGDTVVLNPAGDNTLYENDAGNVSNGVGEHFFAGRSLQPNGQNLKRAVIAFDVAGNVPAGSVITGVTLDIRMSRSNQAGTTPVTLHRVLADWGEGTSDASGDPGQGAPVTNGDATWLHTFYPGSTWTSPGGDFVPTPSATTSVTDSNGFFTWSSVQLVADVQGWVAGTPPNLGWILIGDESVTPSAKRYDSGDNGQAARRPVLTIDFLPPANTGACCFADGSCLVLTEVDCGAQSGVYQADGTSCTPNNCPQPTGACCFTDESCLVLTAPDCAAQSGTYQGDGMVCVPNPCIGITGACCFSGAACTELSPADCATQSGAYQGDGTTCTPNPCPLNLEKFVDPLPVPQPLTPTNPGPPVRYDIAMEQFEQQLHRDLPPTVMWGYNGASPGPLIVADSGVPVEVHWTNDLRDAAGELLTQHHLPVDTCPHGADDDAPRTVVHLHGGHVPAAVDGYPEFTYTPGNTDIYTYPNNQAAGTIWFHDHALGITRLNVYMGLAGLYFIQDANEQALNLPRGEYDIPLVIQDRVFDQDGQLVYPALWEEMYFGDTIMVNGKIWPYHEVRRGKYRVRVLNGSNSRAYVLTLDPPPPPGTIFQIGTDGGLLEAPVELTELTLASGERAELIIDFQNYSNNTDVELVNSAPAPFPGTPGEGVIEDIMLFRVRNPSGFTDPIPPVLNVIPPLLEQDTVQTRDLELAKEPEGCAGSHWLINGLKWDDITEYPTLGSTEVWRFINRSGVMHPMHMHLDFFQILDRQPFEIIEGAVVPTGVPVPPAPNEAGWKDTARVNPGEILRVVAQFPDYTGRYPYHCHILEHEDHEMMRQFEVIVSCVGDLDGNGTVGFADLNLVLSAWGPCSAPCPEDFDGDDNVGFTDLNAVLNAWGPCL